MDCSCPPNHAFRSLPPPRSFIFTPSRSCGRRERSVRADRGCAVRVVGLYQGWCVNNSSYIDPSLTRSCRSPTGWDSRWWKDIEHWASSSTQTPTCTVEPGTAEDVATILRIVNETQAPFAVKGGGHTANPGFSSTPGVHIAMYRFSEVTYDEATENVVVGAGNVWDNVYATLEPLGRMVVGGRVSGVGVAGFTLGGGMCCYSWKTNQYGLTVDTIQAYELVKPSGEIATVTAESDADLFWALKGGFNNYGIVTRFTLKTHPQPEQVWGGIITYTQDQVDKVSEAVANFSAKVTDPKAAIISAYNFLLGEIGISQLFFYDGPEPPSGIFDELLEIPHFSKDVKARSFVDLVTSNPSNVTGGQRGVFNTVSLESYPLDMVQFIANETKRVGSKLAWKSGNFISYDIEPFLPGHLSHGAEGSSAYPPTRAKGFLPLNLYYAWGADLADDVVFDAIRESAQKISDYAVSSGQDISGFPLYPNYAIFNRSLDELYQGNTQRLAEIRARVDPYNVMALAGGFKF
ncbi:FAD-binding domain-containing protein [Schizophyllum commune H4-8]|uniref:FAD-binding PCMH-type domain-containing protein n=1 Tax=Schizophyllum commune (strain H4-8 / FGSC 9210) TaxID=578458 RepID=D8QGU2_SCHCM|nr:FAD-binding domain-containing protein [Schizophyllum commune H4-8]KAI5886885.1 FAD-binding domain-containing protein [Schizophyllum commune H4-8]